MNAKNVEKSGYNRVIAPTPFGVGVIIDFYIIIILFL